jgi:hypothetical protein
MSPSVSLIVILLWPSFWGYVRERKQKSGDDMSLIIWTSTSPCIASRGEVQSAEEKSFSTRGSGVNFVLKGHLAERIRIRGFWSIFIVARPLKNAVWPL